MKSGTTYGLSVYDYIALDASSVEENDLTNDTDIRRLADINGAGKDHGAGDIDETEEGGGYDTDKADGVEESGDMDETGDEDQNTGEGEEENGDGSSTEDGYVDGVDSTNDSGAGSENSDDGQADDAAGDTDTGSDVDD